MTTSGRRVESRARRSGKAAALAAQRRVWEVTGEHVHVLHHDRTECVNGDCAPCHVEGCQHLEGQPAYTTTQAHLGGTR